MKNGGAGGGISGGDGEQYSTLLRAGCGGTQTTQGISYYNTVSNSNTYGTVSDFGNGGASKNTSY